jgi:high-affinity nickel permease
MRSPSIEIRSKIIFVAILLVSMNVLAWLWALISFHAFPLLMGTAFLAYTFGLRHAVDADHIAAIDNVTRKLMQQRQRPRRCRIILFARPFNYRIRAIRGDRRNVGDPKG